MTLDLTSKFQYKTSKLIHALQCHLSLPEDGMTQKNEQKVEMRGLEPRTLRMQSARSTAELHPQISSNKVQGIYSYSKCHLGQREQ